MRGRGSGAEGASGQSKLPDLAESGTMLITLPREDLKVLRHNVGTLPSQHWTPPTCPAMTMHH